jgi:hypothetical protein
MRASAPGASHCATGLRLADAAGLLGRMWLDETPFDAGGSNEERALVGKLFARASARLAQP